MPIKAFKPNGEQIKINGYDETKSQIIGFKVEESGIYRVEVVPTKGKLPENMKLSIKKRQIEEKAQNVQTAPIVKSELSPTNVKEYEAPAGQTTEFTLVLSKQITYSFRMMKGSAKIEVKNDKGELLSATESDELVIKDVEKMGIYKLHITPKGDAEAKVSLAFMKE
jgi:hypothetical protein